MIYLIKMEGKSIFKSYLTWILCVALFLTAFMMLFPEARGSLFLSEATRATGSIHQGTLKALGWMPFIDLTTIEGYFPFLFFYITATSVVFSATTSSSAIAREEEEGTILFLSSQPIGRKHIFWGKWIANIIAFGFYCVFIFALSMLLLFLLSESGNEKDHVIMALKIITGLFLSGIIFISLGVMISCLMVDILISNMAALLCSSSIIVGSMFCRGRAVDTEGFWNGYSFFPISFLLNGTSHEKFGPEPLAFFSGIFLTFLFLFFGYWYYLKKDFTFDTWETTESQ